MKKYIKPSVTVIEYETCAPLLSASGEASENSLELFTNEQNDQDRAKSTGFDLWGDDEY